MTTVTLSLTEFGAAMPLQESLERGGYQVIWDAQSADGPTASTGATDIVILDAHHSNILASVEAWRDHEPPPGILLIGMTEATQRGLDARIAFVRGNASDAVLHSSIESVVKLRFSARLSSAYARAALGLGPASHPFNDAISIVAGARTVDIDLVRESLRWHAYEYVSVDTEFVAKLRQHRALQIPEIEIIKHLDGTHTLQKLVSAKSGEGILVGRCLWGLFCAGVGRLSREPHPGTASGKAIGEARRHLAARLHRLQTGTLYDVLEVHRDATMDQVDYAARTLALRFSPDRLAKLDLAEYNDHIAGNWQQILQAREILMDIAGRANYDDAIDEQRASQKLESPWAFDVDDAAAAEEMFRRGQMALAEGETFKAVSAIAAACRRHPAHPDYEISLCYARYRADIARGGEREELISGARMDAQQYAWGRRPWPRALTALALLCIADNDAVTARGFLHQALEVDSNHSAARQLLARLG